MGKRAVIEKINVKISTITKWNCPNCNAHNTEHHSVMIDEVVICRNCLETYMANSKTYI